MTLLNRLSLKTRLLLLVLAIALPAFAIVAASHVTERRHRIAESQDDTLQLLGGIVARQVQIITGAQQFLATVAEIPAVRERDAAACTSLFKRLLARNPQYGNILALRPDGRGFASAVPLTIHDFSDRRYYRETLQRGDFTIGEYAVARLVDRPVIHFSHPVKDRRGRLVAVLVAALILDQTPDFFLANPLPEGFTFGITDHRGTHLVSHPSHPDSGQGKALPVHFWQAMAAGGDSGFIEAPCPDGLTRLHAYRKFRLRPGTPADLHVYISAEREILLAGVQREMLARLAALGLILLLSAGLALLLGRRGILTPLERLSQTARQITAGNYGARTGIDHGDAEMGQLARAFDGMAEKIAAERQALLESEERYRTLVELSPDIIFIHADERILFINRAGAEKLGKGDPAEMVGRPLWDFIPPADQPIVREQIALGQQVRYREGSYRQPDGRAIPVEIIGVRFASGNRPAHLVIARDLSRRRQLEAHLRQAQKIEAIGTLAGGIAHDFNNLLGGIFGYTEMALDAATDEGQRRDLLSLLKVADRAKNLVSQILAFSRRQEASKQPLELGVALREALNLIRASLPSTVAIEADLSPQPCPVLADPTQIHQILLNLCTNAFQAMQGRPGSITVSLTQERLRQARRVSGKDLPAGAYALLSVGDSGGGIDPQIRHRIFDPFFTTKEVGQGTGLGLSVVHGIVMDTGGGIELQSEPGQGSLFRIYLPLLDEAAASPESGPSALPEAAGRQERLLLVDDEPDLLAVTASLLKSRGYRVTTASDPEAAIALVAEQPEAFDLVLTDMTMPGMTGLDLAQALMRLRPGLPVLLATGYGQLTDPGEIRRLGIRKCLFKPLAAKEVAAEIRAILDQCRVESP